KIQGYITQVLVDEGQYVTKGQPLFRLETNILNENAAASKAGIGAAASSVAAAQASKIQGYITQVLVDEGQYVTKGQPLFRLETNILNE
ncbi:biotin/lipoyl-binding protein, partial [Chryseobacterium sp. CH1]|uniref:biotin/lipoyl-binding protein n=1 Tax=Chryseobacterium sp. CH1 TaxID=713551 RepID=UPI00100BD109